MDETYIDGRFIRDRITELRLEKGVSEYQMSKDIGMSGSYIGNITRADTTLPSMDGFLAICEYVSISPAEFFQYDIQTPYHTKAAYRELERLCGDNLPILINELKKLDKRHADMLIDIIRKIKQD